MPNRFELDGRGPSNGALLLTCLAFALVCALLLTLMVAKSNGALDRHCLLTHLRAHET